MERFTWQECERDAKRKEFTDKVKEKVSVAKEKIKSGAKIAWDNRADIMAVGTVLIAAGSMMNKSAKRRDEKKETAIRERRVYDPSMGDWWDLKKPLTNNERLEMEARVANGELRGEVLRDMGKLKK